MLRTFWLIGFLIVSGSAWAQNGQPGMPHTQAEERACSGDAHRFCREALGDDFRVSSCLQEHRERVSRGCRTMLEGHGM
jgi:hypothetical protein